MLEDKSHKLHDDLPSQPPSYFYFPAPLDLTGLRGCGSVESSAHRIEYLEFKRIEERCGIALLLLRILPFTSFVIGCYVATRYAIYLRSSFTAGYSIRSFVVIELGGLQVVEDVARGSIRHGTRCFGLRDELCATPPVVACYTKAFFFLC